MAVCEFPACEREATPRSLRCTRHAKKTSNPEAKANRSLAAQEIKDRERGVITTRVKRTDDPEPVAPTMRPKRVSETAEVDRTEPPRVQPTSLHHALD